MHTMKTVLITSGGTTEPIDGVRGITNFSSGRLGAKLAEQLTHSKIFLIKSRKSVMPKSNLENITIIETQDTQSVQEAIHDIMDHHTVDVFVHSMAISDYTVEQVVNLSDMIEAVQQLDVLSLDAVLDILQNPPSIAERNKVSSNISRPIIYLQPTPKIIASIKAKWPHTKLVAFKLLNTVSEEELLRVASASMAKTDADYMVANDLQYISATQHKAFIFGRDGIPQCAQTKEDIVTILQHIIEA